MSEWDSFPAVESKGANFTDWDSFPALDQPRQAEMRAYEPTWRDRIGSMIAGDSRSPERAALAEGLVGSRGLGRTGSSIADFTPAGIPMAAQEAAQDGDARGVALSFLPAAPAARPLSRFPIPAPAPPPAPRQVLLDAAERQSVELPRVVASDAMGSQQAGKVAANVPWAGVPLRESSQRAITQLDEAAARVQSGYGSGSAATAGEGARAAVENYIGPKGILQGRVQKAYENVNRAIDQDKISPLTSTLAAKDLIAKRREGAGLSESKAAQFISDALEKPGLRYADMSFLRTNVGELLKASNLPADVAQSELKQIYKALTEDLRGAVKNAGGDKGLALWERANTYTARVAERSENLNRILGAKSDEGVIDRILQAASTKSTADSRLLGQARKAMPVDEWDDIASAVIARMGRDPAMNVIPGQTVSGGGFSPDRFLTAYSKLSDAGRAMLFRSTGKGDLANSLNDIAMISQRFKQLNTFANPSGTGQTVLGGGIGTGLVMEPISALTGILGARAMATVMAQPATAKATATWMRHKLAVASYQKPSASTVAAGLAADRTLANALAAEGLGDATAILRQLQGAAPIRAEGDQEQ